MNLLERDAAGSGFRLTSTGWERFLEISSGARKTNDAFVAMWFDESMDAAWDEGFKPALKDDCKYIPVRIDREHYENGVDDEILARIRASGLVVADFTSGHKSPGGRGGVYFESGFAMGLGVPTVRTCRKDQLYAVHFDLNHYPFIEWESPDELRRKLRDRIQALFPVRDFPLVSG